MTSADVSCWFVYFFISSVIRSENARCRITLFLVDAADSSASSFRNASFYFSAKDESGRKADLSIFVDNQLGSGDVLPGDKSRGFIALDMAPGAATVMISDPLMQEAARIQIPG